MKPGERVRLIKESADSLLTRPWPERQLILDQFGFNTWQANEDYDAYTYLVDCIKDSADDSIETLHEYLQGEDAQPSAAVADRPWGSAPVSVFLSHIHDHRHFVGEVKAVLSRYGIDAFVAHDDIDPSRQWRDVIKAALATCHAFVAFLHDGFHESQWCDQEVGWALGRGVPIVPVRVGCNARRDGFLGEYQDITPRQESAWWVAEQIFKVVLADSRTNAVGVKALAEAFVNSWSYDTTRMLWGLLQAQPHIAPEQLRRLEYAVQTNRQVYEATVTPTGQPAGDAVALLVRRHEPAAAPAWPEEPPF